MLHLTPSDHISCISGPLRGTRFIAQLSTVTSTSKPGLSASFSSLDPSSFPSPCISEHFPQLLRKRHFRAQYRAAVVSRALPETPGNSKHRNRNLQSYPRQMSFVKAHYHPFLFATIMLSAMAELGLTAFLIGAGNEHGTWPSERYHSILIMFLFNAIWTTVFSAAYMLWMVGGGSQFLASVASSIIWLLITTILWVTAAGVMYHTRTGGNCALKPTIHRCRQSLTVEALGWTEFGLCALTLILTYLWARTNEYRIKQEAELAGAGDSTRRLV